MTALIAKRGYWISSAKRREDRHWSNLHLDIYEIEVHPADDRSQVLTLLHKMWNILFQCSGQLDGHWRAKYEPHGLKMTMVVFILQ